MRALLLDVSCLIACLACQAAGKRVVVLPSPSISHAKYHANIARALAKLGHDIWFAIPDFIAAAGVLDTTIFEVIEYTTVPDIEKIRMEASVEKYFQGHRQDLKFVIDTLKEHCDMLLSNTSFFNEVRCMSPDMVIIDNTPPLKMLAVIPYRLGIPFLFVGVTYQPAVQRVPYSPTIVPIPIFSFSHNMTSCQRVLNTAVFMLFCFVDPFVYSDAVVRYAPEMSYVPIDMLVAQAEIWLVEMDHILDYPRPSLPNVKLIGGTATAPAKPLLPEFKSFMDGATEGVVIVSFGSYVLNLPKAISDKVFNVLQQLPMKSIFRSNLTSPDPSKILTSSWIPQNDLLGHPNTKVFVSHCGKNGQYEALFHSVPVVATPLFADQPYNAERMRVKGMAEKLDLKTVTEEDFVSTILKVATDPSYKQAISRASGLFRIEFGVPMERAAFWLDHVMKYGGAYMRSAGQEIPYYQFRGFDVYAVLFSAAFAVLLLLFFCLKMLIRCLCTRKQKME